HHGSASRRARPSSTTRATCLILMASRSSGTSRSNASQIRCRGNTDQARVLAGESVLVVLQSRLLAGVEAPSAWSIEPDCYDIEPTRCVLQRAFVQVGAG